MKQLKSNIPNKSMSMKTRTNNKIPVNFAKSTEKKHFTSIQYCPELRNYIEIAKRLICSYELPGIIHRVILEFFVILNLHLEKKIFFGGLIKFYFLPSPVFHGESSTLYNFYGSNYVTCYYDIDFKNGESPIEWILDRK